MPRNLDRRVEATCSVTEPRLKERLAEILEVNLADDVLAWELRSDGSWQPIETTVGVNTHDRLRELADTRSGARM